MIVDRGLEVMKFRLVSGNTDVISHLAIGSATDIPQRTQTTLGSEYGDRLALSFDAGTSAKVVAIGSLGLLTNNGSPFSEIGIFTQSTTGSMFNRAKFDAVTIESSGTRFVFEWDVVFS